MAKPPAPPKPPASLRVAPPPKPPASLRAAPPPKPPASLRAAPPPKPPASSQPLSGRGTLGESKRSDLLANRPNGPDPLGSKIPPADAADPGLEQIERAMAVLHGVDPDVDARIRREQAKADADKREQRIRLERMLAERRRERARRLRRWVLGLSIAAVTVSGTAKLAQRRVELYWRARPLFTDLVQRSTAYADSGFSLVPHSVWQRPEEASLSLEGPACVLALANAEKGAPRVRIEAGGIVVEGDGSAGLCTCAADAIDASAISSSASAAAVQLMQADPGKVGGVYGLEYLVPPLGALGPAIPLCARQQLDSWVKNRRFPAPQPHPGFLTTSKGFLDPHSGWSGRLAEAGFASVSRIAAGSSFGAFETSADTCAIAVGEPDDRLTLRSDGGEELLSAVKHTLGFCTSQPSAFALFRNGVGQVEVASVPSKRVGGALGFSEVLGRAGLVDLSIWVRSEDLAGSASEALAASGIPQPQVVYASDGTSREVADARVVSIALAEMGFFTPEHPADMRLACEPDQKSAARYSLCVQTRPERWQPRGALDKVGAAAAPLPFWLTVYSAVDDPHAVEQELAILRLARRLSSLRFAPSILEGVTEVDTGIEVLGRNGEDAVVAVGLSARSPWAFPYTDGPAWTLAEDPRVVALGPGEAKRLTARPLPAGGVEDRRTVVFRRRTTRP